MILLELLYFRFDVEEDTDGLSESVDYLIMGYVKHSVPVRDVAHKLYLPHRFYPLNIFPRYKIYVLASFKYVSSKWHYIHLAFFINSNYFC